MMAALLGMLTGIGGGMLRDVLVSQIPTVLRADLYAMAALGGAAVVVIAPMLHVPRSWPRSSVVCSASRCDSGRSVLDGTCRPLGRRNRKQAPRTHQATTTPPDAPSTRGGDGPGRGLSPACGLHR